MCVCVFERVRVHVCASECVCEPAWVRSLEGIDVSVCARQCVFADLEEKQWENLQL